MRGKLIWVVAALTAIAAFGLVAFYLSPKDPFFHRRSFAAEQWAVGDMRARGQMVQDLMTRKLLDGKTRPEVETLLGKADQASTNSLEYRVDVGTRFLGSRWNYRLVLHFEDQRNKVRDVLLID
jgi:hypothetical protein